MLKVVMAPEDPPEGDILALEGDADLQALYITTVF